MFRSFIPRKGEQPKPPPTPQATPAVGAEGWRSILQDHLAAQQTEDNDETVVLVARPEHPHFNNTTEYIRYVHKNSLRPPVPQNPQNPQTPPYKPNFTDPSDLTAIMTQAEALRDPKELRELRYYGDNRAILIVVGMQVVKRDNVGVTIVENGFGGRRRVIPWHRVHDLTYDPRDSF